MIRDAIQKGPNFAGRYRLVQFRMGHGPIGAVIVDVKSGGVFHLPKEVVQEDFYIYDTDCMELCRKWQKSGSQDVDDCAVLSFLPDSELLTIRRCLLFGKPGTSIEKSVFRWHEQRWTLLNRVSLTPPPPIPVL